MGGVFLCHGSVMGRMTVVLGRMRLPVLAPAHRGRYSARRASVFHRFFSAMELQIVGRERMRLFVKHFILISK